jgi:hypothetical protein
VPSDVVDALLGLVGDVLGVVRRSERHLHDVAGRRDQPSKQRRLGDDPCVRRRRRRRRDPLDQLGDVEVAADLREQAASLQLLDRGDRVDGIAAAVDVSKRLEDLGVRRVVEVGRPDDLDDVGDRLAREHHGAEHRFLGLEVVGRHPLRAETPDVVSRSHHDRAPLAPSCPRPKGRTLDPCGPRLQRETSG